MVHFCGPTGRVDRKIRRFALFILVVISAVVCVVSAQAATGWRTQEQKTNIVAVVDCSSSMQSSDSDWKVPESLMMLADMVDDDNINLSLIVYGTQPEVAFRDIPLGDENHTLIQEQITAALMKLGYNRGQTDTGAALSLARELLEEQSGEDNMVLLFTDGAVKADCDGRTDSISRQEIDSFAVWAQDNGAVVNTLGLFNAAAAEQAVEQAEQELSILKSKTGGVYQRVNDPADIPYFVRSILAAQLDCQDLALGTPKEVSTQDGQHGWMYTLTIPDRYVDDVTLVLPSPDSAIQDILIKGAATDEKTVSADALTEATWYSYTRYNRRPGYSILRLNRRSADQWQGSYEITLVTAQTQSPAASGFYRYDVQIHVELGSDNFQVMQQLPVQVYLTDEDGYRIDDLEYLQNMTVEMVIVNLESSSAVLREEGQGADYIPAEEQEQSDSDLFAKLGKQNETQMMDLKSDCFRTVFQPQYVSQYQLTVQVFNDSFSRTVTTKPLTVTDSLQVVSSLMNSRPRKNQPLEVRAYLQQKEDFTKVVGTEYYRLAGASAVFYNQNTGMSETVPMEELEDGNGLSAIFVPTDAGEYTAYVVMDSHQESVQRMGETMAFTIEDHPVTLQKSWFGRSPSSDLMESYFRGYYSGRVITLYGDKIFRDEDGDAFRMDAEILEGLAEEALFDNRYEIVPHGRQTLQLGLSAMDYSGNSAQTTVSIRVLSIFEVIALSGMLIVLVAAVLALLLGLMQCAHQKKNAMRGVLQVEISLNGAEINACRSGSRDGVEGKELALGRFLLELDNRAYVNCEEQERLLKETRLLKKAISARTQRGTANALAYRVELSHIISCFSRCYCNALGRADGVNEYLLYAATQAGAQKISLQGQKNVFRLKNVRRRRNSEVAFVSNARLDRLTQCAISLPILDIPTANALEGACPQVMRAYGLTVKIRYFSQF